MIKTRCIIEFNNASKKTVRFLLSGSEQVSERAMCATRSKCAIDRHSPTQVGTRRVLRARFQNFNLKSYTCRSVISLATFYGFRSLQNECYRREIASCTTNEQGACSITLRQRSVPIDNIKQIPKHPLFVGVWNNIVYDVNLILIKFYFYYLLQNDSKIHQYLIPGIFNLMLAYALTESKNQA